MADTGHEEISALIAAAVLGAMLFFSFVVAPLVFVNLTRKTAGEFMRTLFPVYYLALAMATAIAGSLAWTRMEALVLWLVAGLFLVLRFLLLPALDKARGKDEAAFMRLHRLGVAVNTAQMILLAGAAFMMAG